VPFLVKAPDLDLLEKETNDRMEIEKNLSEHKQYFAAGE